MLSIRSSRHLAWVAGSLLALSVSAHAQTTPTFEPRSGDGFVDATLADINRYASTYRDAFVDEMVRHHDAPRELVDELLGVRRWTPGDVYFACAIAAQAGRPCRAAVDEFEHDPSGGWGAVAQRMGIAPGTPAFHAIKRGFVPTYDRWARPIRIDAELAPEFPGRRVDVFAPKPAGQEHADLAGAHKAGKSSDAPSAAAGRAGTPRKHDQGGGAAGALNPAGSRTNLSAGKHPAGE